MHHMIMTSYNQNRGGWITMGLIWKITCHHNPCQCISANILFFRFHFHQDCKDLWRLHWNKSSFSAPNSPWSRIHTSGSYTISERLLVVTTNMKNFGVFLEKWVSLTRFQLNWPANLPSANQKLHLRMIHLSEKILLRIDLPEIVLSVNEYCGWIIQKWIYERPWIIVMKEIL